MPKRQATQTAPAPVSLSRSDRARLDEFEDKIRLELEEIQARHELDKKSFRHLGATLIELRDSGLWKVYGVKWEEYIPDKFGFVYERADQIMRASEIAQDIVMGLAASGEEDDDMPMPDNERQVRPMSRVSPKAAPGTRAQHRAAVWKAAVRHAKATTKSGIPTGKIVGNMAAQAAHAGKGSHAKLSAAMLYEKEQGRLLDEIKTLYGKLDIKRREEFQTWAAKV